LVSTIKEQVFARISRDLKAVYYRGMSLVVVPEEILSNRDIMNKSFKLHSEPMRDLLMMFGNPPADDTTMVIDVADLLYLTKRDMLL
jgi:hypothetical protein